MSLVSLPTMMKLCGALVLLLTVSVATGLQCYSCLVAKPESCTKTDNCASIFNQCYSMEVNGFVSKGCGHSAMCSTAGFKCCNKNLCNNAFPAGPSVMLLLVSSAILTLFV